MIIHCRDAAADLMPMLREAAARGPLRGVLHAFSGDAAMAAECLDLGLYVSFAGNVTYIEQEVRRAPRRGRRDSRRPPLDRNRQSLSGARSPFAASRSATSRPWLSIRPACLARLRGVPVEQFAADTTANARRLFRLR